MKRIAFVVNVDWFFESHRLPLAIEALDRGWDVFLISKNTGRFEQLSGLGINCISIDFERSGKNPLRELKHILKLKEIYKTINPDIIHHITLKPSIYGTIASKRIKAKVINAVSGLGYSFTDNRRSLSKIILIQLLKWAFKDKKSNFIFQNPDDKLIYDELKFLNSTNYVIIKGAGVDENKYRYVLPTEKDRIQIILAARMLKDKGVFEFIAAANLLKEKYQNKARFILVGAIDLDNPAYITADELNLLCDQRYIVWKGYESDMKKVYEEADIACLPSYREGLPKSLIEAMAIGRPIVTTDAIGCRECVDDNVNGLIVPIKDVEKLAEVIETLILDKNLRIEMGLKSRMKMEKEMSLNYVVSSTFTFYEA